MMNNTIKAALGLAATTAIVGLASTASAQDDYDVSCLTGPPEHAVDYRGYDGAWVDSNGVILAWSEEEDSCLIFTPAAAPARGTQPHRVCNDSNGSARGGSVYLYFNTTIFYCDVIPPQRLHLLGTPSNAACDSVGGHGWNRTNKICWDVDY